MNEVPPIVSGASKTRKRFPWKWIIISIVILFFAAPAFFVGFIILDPWPNAGSADAGFKRAKKTIGPELLRAWAMGEVPKYLQHTNDFFPSVIPNSEIPAYLEKLYLEPVEDVTIWRDAGDTNITINKAGSQQMDQLEITMRAAQTNGGIVEVCWGGPFFHWKFEIGPTNFVLPPDSFVTAVEWVPGIYYTREDTAHPFK